MSECPRCESPFHRLPCPREETLQESIERAGRRDAEQAGELEPQPDSHRGQPWWTPSPDDEP